MEAERYYRAVFAVTLTLLSLAMVAGVGRSLLTSGQLPGVERGYLHYVDEMVRAEEYAPAIEQLRLATKIDFLAGDAARMLASVSYRTGDLDSEIYALRIARRRSPTDVQVRNGLSRAMLERGDLGPLDAKKIIRNSTVTLQVDPNSAVAHGHLADAYRILGDKERSAKHYREALRLDPNLSKAKRGFTREPQGY